MCEQLEGVLRENRVLRQMADVPENFGIDLNKIKIGEKDMMGAGMAIKVGPMLERSRFYVPYEQLENAAAIADDLFAPAEEGEQSE